MLLRHTVIQRSSWGCTSDRRKKSQLTFEKTLLFWYWRLCWFDLCTLLNTCWAMPVQYTQDKCTLTCILILMTTTNNVILIIIAIIFITVVRVHYSSSPWLYLITFSRCLLVLRDVAYYSARCLWGSLCPTPPCDGSSVPLGCAGIHDFDKMYNINIILNHIRSTLDTMYQRFLFHLYGYTC